MSEQEVLQLLTARVRALVAQRCFDKAEGEVAQAMQQAPPCGAAPQPDGYHRREQERPCAGDEALSCGMGA